MRILVVSDTHGDFSALRRAVLSQPRSQVVIHLGDGADEAEDIKCLFPDKMFLQVRGNCDWGSRLPAAGSITLEGKKTFYTHGYSYNVKYGLYEIKTAARVQKANIVLFGHTHRALAEYEDGLYLLNPGSLNGAGGTYGYVDLTSAGVVTNIVKMK